MINPLFVTAAKETCDTVLELPQIIPFIHDATTRKRLARLGVLIQKAKDGILTQDELTEAEQLHARVHVYALMTQNTVILAYLESGIPLLRAQQSKELENQMDLMIMDDDNCDKQSIEQNFTMRCSRTFESFDPAAHLAYVEFSISPLRTQYSKESENQVDLIIMDHDDCDEQSMEQDLTTQCSLAVNPTDPVAPTAADANFDLFGEETLLYNYSASEPPAYSPSSSHMSLPLKNQDEKEDPIIEESRNAKKPKTHPHLKRAACWTLVVTIGPAVLLAPQVRRNLLRPKAAPGSKTKG